MGQGRFHRDYVYSDHTLHHGGHTKHAWAVCSSHATSVPPQLTGAFLLHEDHSWTEMDLSPSLLSTTIRIKWPHFRQWLTLIQHSYLHSEGSDTFKLVYFPTCEKCRNFPSFFYLEGTQMGFKSEGSTWFPKQLDLAQQSWDLNKTGKTDMETQKEPRAGSYEVTGDPTAESGSVSKCDPKFLLLGEHRN